MKLHRIRSRATGRAATALVAGASVLAVLTAASPSTSYLSRQENMASQQPQFPDRFQWQSTGEIIVPQPDSAHQVLSVKDPSLVYYADQWHVFASVTDGSGYSLVYTSFPDWDSASAAEHFYLDGSGIGPGYRAAPQVFYFAPQEKWYLVYQTGNGSFSTTDDITKPESWTAPQDFYPDGMPEIIQENIGEGYWVDFWVICDDVNCYLFSSDDNGHLYRSQTTIEEFPNGFETNTIIAMEDPDRFKLFEAANVYKIKDSDSYLMLIEAIGTDGRRYFRSWTGPAITGPWTPLADTEENPFARANNVTFDGPAWTEDISHGELLRAGYDQTLTIDPCQMHYLYQGMAPDSSGDYNSLPWRLGLLTQTNSPC